MKSNLVLESYWLLVNFFEWSEEGEVQAPGVSMGLFFLKDDVIILRVRHRLFYALTNEWKKL